MLLTRGANANDKYEIEGKTITALGIAKEQGHQEVVGILKQYGAKE
jgi:hypothetical protein